MTDKDELERWRKAFEKTGPETLRLQLGRSDHTGEYRQEAIKWLLEQDARAATIERERFQTMRRWTIIGVVVAGIAAIAALIAAWPVIKDWIRQG
jgi:uncharacterized membrane protein YdbT with pleckstrin-like domain